MECSRISPPGVSNAPLSSNTPKAQRLNASPLHYPWQQRGEGHSRSYPGQTSPRARQTGCPCTSACGNQCCLDSPSPHKLPPREHPGLSAPTGKARSQKPDAVLASCGSSGLSLRAARLAAACRLRQSCRRDRDPVAHHESGVPFATAGIPPHCTKPPPPTPRRFPGKSSGSAAIHARKTACHILQSV